MARSRSISPSDRWSINRRSITARGNRRRHPRPSMPRNIPCRKARRCLRSCRSLWPRPICARAAGSGNSMTALSAPTPRRAPAAMPPSCASATTNKALAMTVDCTPRYCAADPVMGGKQAVAETWRNLCAVGANAARDHRQHEFRQSRKAAHHGPVRGRRAGHQGSLHRARLPGRFGQLQPLQRNQWQPDLPRAGYRRRRPFEGCDQNRRHRFRAKAKPFL